MVSNISPFQWVDIDGHKFCIKRDDLISNIVNGNKARKLQYFLDNDFQHIQTIVSWGGSQSNFMLALAKLALHKKWDFHYYVKNLSKQLKQNPSGNYKQSLDFNMQVLELSSQNFTENYIRELYSNNLNNIYFFQQGGKQKEAELGLKQLADEIKQYTGIEGIKDYSVFIPSGTGASAYYLQKHLNSIDVYTVPCIGSEKYLTEQIDSIRDKSTKLPTIITSPLKYTFAKPHKDLIGQYRILLEQANIEFDLLYDPVGWISLLHNVNEIKKPIIYIHCGGVEGNQSMLARYKYLGIN
jgi:1-aminocyclopropane-1-carboxylate deaminase